MQVLLYGIDVFSSQWYGWIFILCYTHLKLALLLHKQGLVATGVGTTVIFKDHLMENEEKPSFRKRYSIFFGEV